MKKVKILSRWEEYGRDGYGKRLKIGKDNCLYLKPKHERQLKELGMKHRSKVLIILHLK